MRQIHDVYLAILTWMRCGAATTGTHSSASDRYAGSFKAGMRHGLGCCPAPAYPLPHPFPRAVNPTGDERHHPFTPPGSRPPSPRSPQSFPPLPARITAAPFASSLPTPPRPQASSAPPLSSTRGSSSGTSSTAAVLTCA